MLITTSEVATKTAASVAATSPSACRNSGVEGARLMPAVGASWRARDLRREDVALVAHGADQLLALAAVVELAPEATDLHVDGAVEGVRLRPAGVFQQLVAREHPLRPLHEGAEQGELAARGVHHRALGRAQLVAHEVEPPAGELAGSVQAVVATWFAAAAQ